MQACSLVSFSGSYVVAYRCSLQRGECFLGGRGASEQQIRNWDMPGWQGEGRHDIAGSK